MAAALDAAKERQWDDVLSNLERLDLDHERWEAPTKQHALHVLGIAQLVKGNLETAKSAWTSAAAIKGGDCSIEPWLDLVGWAEASRLGQRPANTAPETAQVLQSMLDADAAMAAGRPDLAVGLMRPWFGRVDDLQFVGRTAAALLAADQSDDVFWIEKMAMLGRFLEIDNFTSTSNTPLPKPLRWWNLDEFQRVKQQVQDLLDGMS
jgi:hypothetical protein